MRSGKEKNLRGYRMGNVLKLAKKMKPYHIRMAGAVTSGILHHLFAILTSVCCSYIVGLALEGRLSGMVKPLMIALGVCVCVRVLMYFSEMWLAHDVAFKVLADFRILLFEAIERVSPAILLDMRSGQLASTLMSDVELLEWFFAHSFGSILVAVVVPVILLCFLAWIHPLLALSMLGFLVVLVFLPFLMRRKADRQGMEVRERLGEANAVTVEGVQGMKEILTLNYLEQYRKKNQHYMQKMYKSQYEYGKRLGTEGALIQLTVGLSIAGVLAISAYLSAEGRMDFVWFPTAVTLAGMIFNPVVEICNTARNFGLIFAAANRVFQVLEAEPMVEDRGKENRPAKLPPDIRFEHVTFRYQDGQEAAVKDLSFQLSPGETVALVGSSGAGKTTCTNLLLRYWDVEDGCISIGGTDIREISLDSLHQMTSAVLQEVYLFHTTIRENIRLGKPDATDQEVEWAAKAALAHEFILQLPEGYETKVEERGSSLSGGQRQRIAIARALLKNAPILIMDEAVSSLDTENEKEIQHTLNTVCRDKTILLVAHRLSTIASADRLIVLDHGRVVQTGRHEDLIRQDGYYRDLICKNFSAGNDAAG